MKRGISSIWKYRELLPIKGGSRVISLQEGGTPLIKSKRLNMDFGIRELYLKDETRNPTGSFKDRPLSVVISKALEEGARSIVTASTGNAAASAAAYSSLADLLCYVLFQLGSPTDKILQAVMYGAKIVAVENLFKGKPGKLEEILKGLQERLNSYNAFCWAPFNPYPLEGSKTISYEVCEQLMWKAPDVVVSPVGGGDNLAGQWKGYKEFRELGLIDELPRMIGVQAEGAAPLVKAWKEKKKKVEPIRRAETIASGLKTSYSGTHALQAIYESKGSAVTVSDEDILEAEKELARKEGIWAEPSSTVVIAALATLIEEGLIEKSETVLCTITGSGFKDLRAARDLCKKPVSVRFDINDIVKAIQRV